MMDNGFPFTTEPNSLMEMIPSGKGLKKWVGDMTGQGNMTGTLPDGSLTNTPWRKSGVKYATNEIYFDITEEIDATMDANGQTSSCEVNGEVLVNCKLSGMPDLTLALSNPHILDDVSFHPCVRYNRFDQNKVISFVPPDGSFKLMNYRVKGQLQVPLYVKPQISFTQMGGKISVMVGTKNNTGGKAVEDVVVTIPFPKIISSTSLSANHGQVQYDDINKVCKWIVGKIPTTGKTPMLEGNASLPPGVTRVDSNPVLQVDFKVQMYTPSGIKVDSLSLHNEKYKPFKGVRTITKSGKFHIRS
jgi:AP-3 complex subunit mu